MRTTAPADIGRTLTTGVLAGMAGGMAEIAWIAVYGAVTGTRIDSVARSITGSVLPGFAVSPLSVETGVSIHLALAVALGLALALALWPVARRDAAAEGGFVVLALAAVWAVNFLIVLPRLNPEFVHLLPYGVTLLSKLLFGMSAATVFRARTQPPRRVNRRRAGQTGSGRIDA